MAYCGYRTTTVPQIESNTGLRRQKISFLLQRSTAIQFIHSVSHLFLGEVLCVDLELLSRAGISPTVHDQSLQVFEYKFNIILLIVICYLNKI